MADCLAVFPSFIISEIQFRTVKPTAGAMNRAPTDRAPTDGLEHLACMSTSHSSVEAQFIAPELMSQDTSATD